MIGSDESNKLGSTDGKVIGTILGDVYRIALVIYVRTELGSLDVSIYGSNDGKLEGLLIGYSLEYTDGEVLVSDEGIKMRLSGGKVLGIIIVNVDGIIIGIDVGTYLGCLDGSLDGFNDGSLED